MIPDNYKTVSFIIPTIGRNTLQRTLDSIKSWPGDEVIVIRNDGTPHGYGGKERNIGIAQATCDYLSFMDDDDIYVPDARMIMHNAILENPNEYPILFRIRFPNGEILWKEPKFKNGNVGTTMIFVPNKKEMFPEWGKRYCADFNWLNCLGWSHHKFIWREEIICEVGHE